MSILRRVGNIEEVLPEQLRPYTANCRGRPANTVRRRKTAGESTKTPGLEPLTVTPLTNFDECGGEDQCWRVQKVFNLVKEERISRGGGDARAQFEGGTQIIDITMLMPCWTG